MKLPPKGTWVSALAAFLLLMWIYVTDLIDTARARSEEVAAMTALPNPFFAGGVVLFTLAAASLFLSGAAQDRGEDFRGYRLLPILAVGVLFLDLFVLRNAEPAQPGYTTARAIEGLAQTARGPGGTLVSDEATLAAVTQRLGSPQYLVRGKRVAAFSVKVRQGCEGPALERSGEPVGTLIFCVNRDGNHAWITAVGLPDNRVFGEGTIFSVGGRPYVGQVGAGAPPLTPPGVPPTGPSTSAGGG